jgi:hypothetical protein
METPWSLGPPRMRAPLICALCKTTWDRMASRMPSCSHTEEEWQQQYVKAQDRRRWLPVDNPMEYLKAT